MAGGEGFYVTGGTLRRDAPSYVRRKADDDLYVGLKAGRLCYVLTARQLGKSSLMVRTAGRLREEGVSVVVLDLTAIGQNITADQWYDGLLARVGEQLELEEELEAYWNGNLRLGPLQRWMGAIREVLLARRAGPLVIFIDEIDAVRSLPFSTDEFFAGIREFYNRRSEDAEMARLTFCLLGVASPSDLIRDMRTTPFNVGQRIELSDFTESEAQPLAEGLGRDPQAGASLLKRIFHWTGGHPYLTQRLCQAVAGDAGIQSNLHVDRLAEALFLSPRARERDDNLLFVRERILRSETDLAALLDLYAQVHNRKRVRDDDTSPLISILRLSGITRVMQEGYLSVRNRIYYQVFDRVWVNASMPDAELRRQRAAFRRGVIRTTAIAALVLALVGCLAFMAVKQRNRAEVQRLRADQKSEEAKRNAEKARQASVEADLQRRQAIQGWGTADQQRQRAEQEERSNRRLLYAAQMDLSMRAWESASIGRMEELLEASIPKPGEEDLRGFEWHLLWRLSHSYLKVLRHGSAVASLSLSPDGKILASAGDDHTVKLWSVPGGQELLTLKGHTDAVLAVAFSPDGKLLATGSADKSARIWDVALRKTLFILKGHSASVNAVAFSRDGKTLATGSDDTTVKFWNVLDGQERATLRGHRDKVVALAFSPDGTRLVSGGADGAKQWATDILQQAPTFRSSGPVFSVAWSPDGKTLATASQPTRMYRTSFGSSVGSNIASATNLLDAATGQSSATSLRETSVETAERGTYVAFSWDGKLLASASYDRLVRVYDAAGGQLLFTLKGHDISVDSMVFSRDGRLLITAGRDGAIKYWDVAREQQKSGILYSSMLAPQGAFSAAAFSPDGKWLATTEQSTASPAANKTILNMWDVITGKKAGVFRSRASQASSVAFSPDGAKLASGGSDKTVRLWSAAGRRELATLRGHAGEILCLAFSPDGRTLASGSADGQVKLWDTVAGKELAAFSQHSGRIHSVAFSPDGKKLATGSEDHTAKLWHVETGKKIFDLRGHRQSVDSVAFSPDGTKLATAGGDADARLWDVATGREVAILRGHSSQIKKVAFSPDGKRLATGSSDQTAKLWDVSTQKELIVLRPNTSVEILAFSPDGRMLAASAADPTPWLQFWQTDSPAEEAARLRSLYPEHIRLAREALSAGNLGMVVGLLRSHMPGPDQEDWRGFEWYYLWRLAERKIFSVSISTAGRGLATDGKILAAGGIGTIRLWDLSAGQELSPSTGPALASPLPFAASNANLIVEAISPDGRIIAGRELKQSNVVKLWDSKTGRELANINPQLESISLIAFSPDGKTLAIPSRDNTARLWDIAASRELVTLKGHTQPVTSAVFTPDGAVLATASYDSTIKLWDAGNYQELASLESYMQYFTCLAISPDGKTLAGGSADGTLSLWDLSTKKELVRLEGDVTPRSLAFSGDGKLLASQDLDGSVNIWEIAAKRVWISIQPSGSAMGMSTLCRFASEGDALIASGPDNTVTKWDLAPRPEAIPVKLREGGSQFVALSTDRKLQVTADDKGIRLLNGDTHKELVNLSRHTRRLAPSILSPDGKTRASGSRDGPVTLQDAATHKVAATLRGHTGPVSALAYSPDGKRLASAGEDGTVKFWDVIRKRETLSYNISPAVGAASMAFASDQSLLCLLLGDGSLQLLPAATEKEVQAQLRNR